MRLVCTHPFWEQDYCLIHTTACQGRKGEWRSPRHTNKRCDYMRMSKIVGKREKQARTELPVYVKSVDTGQNVHVSFQTCQFYKGAVAWQQFTEYTLFRWDAKTLFFRTFVITLKSSIWDFWIKTDLRFPKLCLPLKGKRWLSGIRPYQTWYGRMIRRWCTKWGKAPDMKAVCFILIQKEKGKPENQVLDGGRKGDGIFGKRRRVGF